jgi:soluble lytic murein transglycosylase-like protein
MNCIAIAIIASYLTLAGEVAKNFCSLIEPPAITSNIPQPPAPDLVTPSKEELHGYIQAAAKKHQVPAAFVKSIVAAESNFDCQAISPKGAIGLMQLMPETAEAYGVDPKVPEQNIDGGTRYLRVLMDKYHRYRDSMKCVIAAYNAGPGVVDRYRGVPPYRETRKYVTRVLTYFRKFQYETRVAFTSKSSRTHPLRNTPIMIAKSW